MFSIAFFLREQCLSGVGYILFRIPPVAWNTLGNSLSAVWMYWHRLW